MSNDDAAKYVLWKPNSINLDRFNKRQ
jgi:hypothetical protein